MKTSQSIALAAVVFTLCGITGKAFGQDPAVPVGTLTATPEFVQVGSKPTLSWGITYPSIVKDIIKITAPGTCTPKVPVTMEVRVIGASVKVVWTNNWGQVTRWEWAPTEAMVSVNSSSYSSIFYNTQDKVNPSKVVYTKNVGVNEPVNFAGHYYFSNSWSTLFRSTNANGNVVALVNGDTPPTSSPLYQQPTIEDFIRPYLDGAGNIKVGPRDVIYLMELTHTNKQEGGFDLQDLALLVTFTPKNNNGHGNNVDGVDSSNPGNAPFTDTDPTVDDEN